MNNRHGLPLPTPYKKKLLLCDLGLKSTLWDIKLQLQESYISNVTL